MLNKEFSIPQKKEEKKYWIVCNEAEIPFFPVVVHETEHMLVR